MDYRCSGTGSINCEVTVSAGMNSSWKSSIGMLLP